MTPDIMLKLKQKLSSSSMTKIRRRLVWLCATWCWAGAFRVHEILSRDSLEFDPSSTLLLNDITEYELVVNEDRIKAIRLDYVRSYTGAMFNRDLKILLEGVVDYAKGNVTAHSFRSGLATFMSRHSWTKFLFFSWH